MYCNIAYKSQTSTLSYKFLEKIKLVKWNNKNSTIIYQLL